MSVSKFKQNTLKYVALLVLGFYLSGCATVFDPAKEIGVDQGIVVTRIHLSGEVPKVNFLTYNKNKTFDLYQFTGEGAKTIAPVTMPVGQHAFDKAMYMQGIELVDPDLTCLGEFEVTTGTITYIGDIYFDTQDYDNYILFTSHPYRIAMADNMEETVELLFQTYPALKGKYKLAKDISSPFICND